MRFVFRLLLMVLAGMVALATVTQAQGPATNAPIAGEIQFLSVDNPADVWSGGTVVVGGQTVIIPRNLLVDLPANRLTLQQIFEQAPPTCKALGESGLARGDACLGGGAGGIATIAANRTSAGNLIAGDVFLEKGQESVSGQITFIDHTDGYLRLNGIPGDPATGVMVRLNDPDGRHSIQQGAGCDASLGPNCSADPRFTLDPDNYTVAFVTGYPACLPSTQPRSFPDLLDLNGNGDTAESLTAQSAADGTGDLLCPDTNRSLNGGQPVDDSRRFAPLQVGDTVDADGNFELVNGVYFLSAHTLRVHKPLTTQNLPTQPDYLFLEEVFIDAMGFNNERARALFIGFTTRAPTEVDLWTIHYDPASNAPHEFPLGSTVNNPDTINQGIVIPAGGGDIFRIRYDVDFILGAPVKAGLSPCQNLTNAGYNVCPNGGTMEEEFAILSPMPREIHARTRHLQAHPGLVNLDVNGNPATWGQYLFPLGMGLGGVEIPEFVEIDLAKLDTPFLFSGLPWLLDRRLSPGGCDGPCEAAPQPLDPFPFSGLDPRTQAGGNFGAAGVSPGVPSGPYSDPAMTASTLSNTRDRILSFVDATQGKPDGDNTVLS
ncbi:MAG: hypothetical protein D6796_15560, partial [Caldilineae bacterium]